MSQQTPRFGSLWESPQTWPIYAGLDNTFALLDLRAALGSLEGCLELGIQSIAEVRLPEFEGVADLESAEGRSLDGCILLVAPDDSSVARVIFLNADGSRPEACGNGLRCVALHLSLQDSREAMSAGSSELPAFPAYTVQTDAGTRRLQVTSREPFEAQVSLGSLQMAERFAYELPAPFGFQTGWSIDIGNPHLVLQVNDLSEAPVRSLGALLQTHPAFPHGVNVGFVESYSALELDLRVWERGVGETAACGTGACAAAIARQLDLAESSETRRERVTYQVRLPGGSLQIELATNPQLGELLLGGRAECLGGWDRTLSRFS